MVVVASTDDAADMNDQQWFDGRVEGGPDADALLGRFGSWSQLRSVAGRC